MFAYLKSFFVTPDSDKFYYLSLIKDKDGSWSIHGLWPQNSVSDYPTYCKKLVFDPRKIDSIRSELEQKWHSYVNTKNDSFWAHEWEKHGSCVFTPMSELDYFKRTLDLFDWALEKDLPKKFQANGKCLIPVNLQFQFIDE